MYICKNGFKHDPSQWYNIPHLAHWCVHDHTFLLERYPRSGQGLAGISNAIVTMVNDKCHVCMMHSSTMVFVLFMFRRIFDECTTRT